jgi:regulator of protease activity HflC (stomatin/prohibitin superfamily)
MFVGIIGPIFVVLVVVIVVSGAIKILREYERAVVFTLGRFTHVKGPGLVLLIPLVQQIVRVDLRTVVMEVPSQDLISRDNVSVKVDAVLYFHVVDPEKSVIQVEQFISATNLLAQTTLRSVLGQHDLDEMLGERAKLNTDIQDILDARTKAWGIEVSAVEIRDVALTENMVKAIAKQAEAERDRRAKSSMRTLSFRPPRYLSTQRRFWVRYPQRCSCATCKHSAKWAAKTTRRSSSRCRSISSNHFSTSSTRHRPRASAAHSDPTA